MKPELLAPAGDWPSLRAAIEAGANAVYFGIQGINMRANAKNFKLTELKTISSLCKENKVKSYLTLNTIIYSDELTKIEKIIKKAKEEKISAIICWDLSVIQLCKKHKIPFHISTQASVSNKDSSKFYKKLGAKRIVLARELNLKQIKEISKVIDVEVFAHGALCYSVSGRCFLSQEMYGKSANRGECIQPCRRNYLITDSDTKKQIKVENNYCLSPKDLCTLPFLDKLIKAGIKSIKIEGRNRSPEYVKEVTESYRQAIDKGYSKELLAKVEKVYNRKFSTGFYLGLPTSDDLSKIYGSASKEKKKEIGRVYNYYKSPKVTAIEMTADVLKIGDEVLIIGNKTGVIKQKITSLETNNKQVKQSKRGQLVAFKTEKQTRPNDKVYKILKRKK